MSRPVIMWLGGSWTVSGSCDLLCEWSASCPCVMEFDSTVVCCGQGASVRGGGAGRGRFGLRGRAAGRVGGGDDRVMSCPDELS
jgi:hypothetical protein